ncbi:MAG: heavy-metal-associated domain-containing protein [Chloroflexi bacterium]|nr:heavy-metal-associated domain-containing protein [Chloroflexota bacterium]
MANVEHVELTVQGKAIHCSGCESRIETVLKKLPGVVKAKADHNTQRIVLTLDVEKTPVDEVKQKLEFAGYRTGSDSVSDSSSSCTRFNNS